MSDNFSANAELSFDTNDFIASANAASKALERIEQQSEETASALDSTQNSENALNAAFKQSQTVVGGLAKQYDALVRQLNDATKAQNALDVASGIVISELQRIAPAWPAVKFDVAAERERVQQSLGLRWP